MSGGAEKKKELALAGWAENISWSAIQEMMVIGSRPDVLSLALGLPATELLPAIEYARAVERVLTRDPLALQYGVPFEPLKSQVAALMSERGVACTEDEVFLTAGAQQGMSLLARLLLAAGRQVICEEFIYTGFQQVLLPFGPEILPVPTDPESGIDVEAVEYRLQSSPSPAFIYVITDGHNPMGTSIAWEKRVRLVELARQYGVPLIEDDAYGLLSYGESLPPLRALDREWVFYVGSFSKILAPALRVGWVVVPQNLVQKLAIVKESLDINTSTFTQRTISAYLETGDLNSRLTLLRDEYRSRRDAMLAAMRENFAGRARWWKPAHGLFLWGELLQDMDMDALLTTAVRTEKVAFIPGKAFYVNSEEPQSTAFRLNFSHCAPDRIREGIARLARAVDITSSHTLPRAGTDTR